MNGKPANIALYWDFENMHASVLNAERGPDAYGHANKFRKQETVLDVATIMEYVRGLGAVNINKAFANWSFLHAYSYVLQEHAVDLIQLFPKGGHGKNGADIRMAIEVIEDLAVHPHLDTIVIVGGDSDYIAVAQKVRQKGRQIIGIGVKGSTNGYWMKSCNEFKYYQTLLIKSSSAVPSSSEEDASDREEAKSLLIKAINHLVAQVGEPSVVRAAVKPAMLRLDPTFDEADYGFASFTEFLRGFPEAVSLTEAAGDFRVAPVGGVPGFIPPEPEVHLYATILKKQQIRMPDPQLLLKTCTVTPEIFLEKPILSGTDQFREELSRRLGPEQFPPDCLEISKLKTAIYRTYGFRLNANEDGKGIALAEGLDAPGALFQNVLAGLIQRITDNIPPDDIDFAAMAELLLGDPAREAEIRAIHESRPASPNS
jgi:uncharacterized LabA/DUF88 family protein